MEGFFYTRYRVCFSLRPKASFGVKFIDMRILFYLLVCFTALTATGQISDSQILEEVIEHLEYYEENQYDRMIDYSIKSSSETVTSAFGDFTSIYSRAAMLEYRTYDGKRAIYKGIVGVARDTRPGSDGRYFVLFGDEHIYKFGTWLIKVFLKD